MLLRPFTMKVGIVENGCRPLRPYSRGATPTTPFHGASGGASLTDSQMLHLPRPSNVPPLARWRAEPTWVGLRAKEISRYPVGFSDPTAISKLRVQRVDSKVHLSRFPTGQ